MYNMKRFILFIVIIISLISCKTVDLEVINELENEEKLNETDIVENNIENEEKDLLIAEEMKVQDVEETIVYIEKPVYVPYKENNTEKKVTGIDAVKKSNTTSIIKPEHYKNGTFFYTYNENLVYEIYCQPYHLTDIILEDGEVVIGNPLLSEDESVWELTANVAKNPVSGANIQHLFIKPAYANLDSSFVVITDRRVYHFRLKSYRDTHMSMVKFKYPQTRNVWAMPSDKNINENGISVEEEYFNVTNPEFLSFDYKIKYNFKKPEFLPKRVYDDGRKTYIVVDEVVLHKQLPIVFNERNEIVNYSVQKNVFIIPRLINKITLRLGKNKVIIEKKEIKENELNKTLENQKG